VDGWYFANRAVAGPACGLSQPEPLNQSPTITNPPYWVISLSRARVGCRKDDSAAGAIDAAQDVCWWLCKPDSDEAGRGAVGTHERGVEVRVG
jgi:hypothetical protein